MRRTGERAAGNGSPTEKTMMHAIAYHGEMSRGLLKARKTGYVYLRDRRKHGAFSSQISYRHV